LVADANEVAPLSGEPLALEQRSGAVAGVDRQAHRAAGLGQFRERLDKGAARALASEFGIDEQHIDQVCAFEAGEARDCAVDHGEQGQRPGEPGAESLFIIGARRPSRTLLFVIVFGRQLLDARAKDLGAPLRVGRDVGAQSDGAHRLSSQVVAPSLVSLIATPSTASRSRNRSDSAQFRAARA